MRKALSSIVDHAYDRWDINRIQATTDLDNHASIGLLRSLGFIEEGIMRQGVLERRISRRSSFFLDQG